MSLIDLINLLRAAVDAGVASLFLVILATLYQTRELRRCRENERCRDEEINQLGVAVGHLHGALRVRMGEDALPDLQELLPDLYKAFGKKRNPQYQSVKEAKKWT